MIDVYLNGTPWAVPVTVAAFVVLLAAGRGLARRTGVAWIWLVLFGTAVAGFLGVIATPDEWVPAGSGPRQWLGRVELPTRPFSLADQATLNAWLAVPMSALAGWALVRLGRRWPVAVVVVAPVLAEATQWLFPSFGRVAFSVGDLTCNVTGVVVGLALGAAAAGLARVAVRQAEVGAGSQTAA